MRLHDRCAIKVAILTMLLQGVLFGGIGGTRPVTALAEQADVVLIAAVQEAHEGKDGVIHVMLQTLQPLAGVAPASPFDADLQPSTLMRDNPGSLPLPKDRRKAGLWFLRAKQATTGYDILPLAAGDYIWDDAFLPLRTSEWPSREGTIQHQVLQAALNWYRGLAEVTPGDDARILVHLENADRQDALAAAEVLIESTITHQHIIGLAAAIRLGSDNALAILAQETPTLEKEPTFVWLTNALQLYYRPRGESSIAALENLVALHSKAPGIDDAVASALRQIGTKQVLPAMAQLLDSRDPQARLRAASFFGYFALFADADGNIAGDNRIGPFATDETKQAMPRSSSDKTPGDYAAFWKAWWSENRAKLLKHP